MNTMMFDQLLDPEGTDKPIAEIFHVIGDNGQPICGFTHQPPRYWPLGHGWINRIIGCMFGADYNCSDCKAKLTAADVGC